MNKIKIMNEGRSDNLDPLEEDQMCFLFGGEPKDKDSIFVICFKGYTKSSCNCGYLGPVIQNFENSIVNTF